MVPRIGATSGMNTARLSSPIKAVPMPTVTMALTSGTKAAMNRRKVNSSTKTAMIKPRPSDSRLSDCDSDSPISPPSATSQSGALSIPVCSTSSATSSLPM